MDSYKSTHSQNGRYGFGDHLRCPSPNHSLWTVYGTSPRPSPSINRRPVGQRTVFDDHNIRRSARPRRRIRQSPFRSWCRITGWHGFLDCYQADDIVLRTFWAAIIIITAFLGTSQILSMLYDYMSADQWVTNVQFKHAGPEGLPMPNVSICSFNAFNQSYLNWLGIGPSTLMLAKKESYYNFYNKYLSPRPMEIYTREYNQSIRMEKSMIQQLLARHEKDIKDGIKEFLQNGSHSCQASVLACGLTTDSNLENGVSCCEKNYFEGADYCVHLSFHDDRGKPMYLTSEAIGVYLLLHPRLDDYNPIFVPDNMFMPAAGFTVKLSLDNAGSIPLLISPGTHNMIWMNLEKRRTVSRKLRNAITWLYSLTPPCIKSKEYNFLDMEYYDPELCRADCDIARSLKICGCIHTTGYPIRKEMKSKSCNAEQALACYDILVKANNSDDRYKAMPDDAYNECRAACIEPCQYGLIKVNHNAAMFPAPNKAVSLQRYVSRVVGENFTLDDVRQFISIQIAYESMYFRSIEKFNRVSLDELISNIGGTMGVWTGISVISLIQIVTYFWYCILNRLETFRDKR